MLECGNKRNKFPCKSLFKLQGLKALGFLVLLSLLCVPAYCPQLPQSIDSNLRFQARTLSAAILPHLPVTLLSEACQSTGRVDHLKSEELLTGELVPFIVAPLRATKGLGKKTVFRYQWRSAVTA